MTSVGHRPTLTEILRILGMCTVSGATELRGGKWVLHITWDTGSIDESVEGWSDGLPKPTWLFEEIKEHLRELYRQRLREEQWVSKEEKYGASIDTVIAHWHEQLRRASNVVPETIATRLEVRILSNTIMRLQELKERREAGGVYSATDDKREKARKAWMEDEYEAPKREEQQRRQREKQSGLGDFGLDEEIRRQTEELFNRFRNTAWESFYGADGSNANPPPRQPRSTSKRPWHEVLGVSVTASKKDITKAYRRLAARFHPDRYKEADGHEKMAEINAARDVGLGGL